MGCATFGLSDAAMESVFQNGVDDGPGATADRLRRMECTPSTDAQGWPETTGR